MLSNKDKKILKSSLIVSVVLSIVFIIVSIILYLNDLIKIYQMIWMMLSTMLGYLSAFFGYLKIVNVTWRATDPYARNQTTKFIINNITNMIVYGSILLISGFVYWPTIFMSLIGIESVKIMIVILYGIKGRKGGGKVA